MDVATGCLHCNKSYIVSYTVTYLRGRRPRPTISRCINCSDNIELNFESENPVKISNIVVKKLKPKKPARSYNVVHDSNKNYLSMRPKNHRCGHGS